MSIINDALKKTQENLSQVELVEPGAPEGNQNPTPSSVIQPPPPQPPPNASNRLEEKKKISWGGKIVRTLSLFFFLSAGLYLSAPYFSQLHFPQLQNLQPLQNISEFFKNNHILRIISFAQEKSAAFTPAAVKKAQPVKQSPPPNTLTLSGIVGTETEKIALINNQIYKIGDSVDGKRILNIFADKVELEDSGGILTLHIQ